MKSDHPMHRKRDEPEDEGWLITFADMAVLLMCFFVLLFVLSSPNTEKFEAVSQALRAKGFVDEGTPTEDAYEKIKKQISLSLAASGFDQFVAASATPKAIYIELSSGAFFMPGSAQFSPSALPMLEMIAAQIMPVAKAEVMIEVEGHTDDVPIQSAIYPSNWELSGARAANVVRFLIAKGFPPQKLRAVGLAATRPKAENRDAAGVPIPANQDLNRRVVVKLTKEDEGF